MFLESPRLPTYSLTAYHEFKYLGRKLQAYFLRKYYRRRRREKEKKE